MLATYAVLIETWRVILRGWQHEIPFLDAARIWTISNLGKYLPGKVWSITALAVMSREYGVSAAEGATASVLVTLINTIVGFAVAIVAGASLLRLPPALVVVDRARWLSRCSRRRRRCPGSACSRASCSSERSCSDHSRIACS